MRARNPSQVTFGPFRLDRPNHRLHRGVTIVPLRPKAFAVLDYLVAQAGRLVTKDQLLAAVWADTAVTDTVLKVCVREIRDALGDDPDAPRFVETAHRLGYRFISQTSQTNLPVRLSGLVGRQREITEIVDSLEASRLVTLAGAGGSGKSRLALEVAGSVEAKFEDGVWWVDLTPLSDESFVPQAVASALGVREQPGQSLTRTLVRFLATKEVLLVVDNCEHVVGASAILLQDLLQAAPRTRVLATSREPLRIDGERISLVPPLSFPDSEDALSPDQALEYEAIRLLVERAEAALPSFVLSPGNCGSAVAICRRLDGIPLAIELAAARIRVLSLEQIAARLHDCFRVLGAGHRTEVARHQTLRAAIDWSFDLLTDAERQMLRRLSVFVGSFTVEAAEHIVAGFETNSGDVFDIISHLIDKSLVFVTEQDGPYVRYRLLETVRQYAHEKFLADEDESRVSARHAQYYAGLAEAFEPGINTRDRQTCLAQLEREHPNLRAAIERASRAGEHDDASRLATALFWFWFHRGHWHEGRTFLASAVHHAASPTRSRARALMGEGVLAWTEGDLRTAGLRLEECATIARMIDERPTAAHALHFLAMVRLAEGDPSAGRPLGEQAVDLARTTADTFCLTIALASYGVVLLALEEYDNARAALEESASRGREAGDAWVIALPLRNLAVIAHRQGDYGAARRLLEESLHGLRGLGEKWFLSRSIETLAEVMASAGEHERAARLFGAAETLRDAVGASVLAFYRADYDRAIDSVRSALGRLAFESCWIEGRRLAPEEAVAYALRESSFP